ncbi:LexA family transcriptional regulator [Enterobacteriaceae bacterium ML5]|nr:LexA family transcriptional regulator [Enterobacteriaceae bacterium ML5]
MNIGDRVKAKRLEMGLSQDELATRSKTTQQSIVNVEIGKTKSPRNLLDLAKALNVSPEYLKDGVEAGNVSYVGIKENKGQYPLVSWVSAGCWLEAVEPYRKDEIDVWPETTVDASDNSFWLRVKGDSMTSPVGFTVPEGMIILVDPEREPASGKLVVAKLENENEATFKQYMIDAGRCYLKALNPHHPPTIVNGNCKIIGVVVDIKWEHIP